MATIIQISDPKDETTDRDIKSQEITLIFRDNSCKNIKISFNPETTQTVKTLRASLKSTLSLTDETSIKLIFKGKIMEDSDMFSKYKFENDDVVLYMVTDKKLDITINQGDANSNNQIQNQREFESVAHLGLSNEDLNILRTFLQVTEQRNSENSAQNLPNQNQQGLNENLVRIGRSRENSEEYFNIRNQILAQINAISELRRNQRTIRNLLRPEDFNIQIELENEPNSRFFLGLMLGLFLGYFTLIFILTCRMKRKFSAGMKIGMMIFIFYDLARSLH